MKYLVDSHVLLWLIAESDKIGMQTKNLLLDPEAQVFVSVASLWELGMKANKGRLPLSFEGILAGKKALGAGTVDVDLRHIEAMLEEKVEHSDPFDLMLCAQARAEDMTLVTADAVLLTDFSKSADARA